MQVEIASAYRPHAKQREMHASGARYLCMACGTRGGKTISAVAEFLRRIYGDLASGKGRQPAGTGRNRSPRLRYWLVAPTYPLVREAVMYVSQMVPPELVERSYEDCLWLKPDLKIEYKSADNVVALQGAGVDGMLIDEAARVKPEAWMGGLSARLTANKGWCIFASTPTGQNWFYKEIFLRGKSGAEGSRDDHASFQWRTEDNPHIPREEIEFKRSTLPKRWFLRDFEASFAAFHGTVFDEFAEADHVCSEAEFRLAYQVRDQAHFRNLFRRISAGVDWGWTGPGAIVVIGHLGEGRYVVLEEAYAPHKLVVDPQVGADSWVKTAVDLRDKWGISDFWADPSQPANIHVFLNHGLSCWPANNDVSYGLRRVNELLHPYGRDDDSPKRARLQILSHCKNLIREMKSYVWAEKKGTVDDLKEEPAPNQSDHAIDALRYSIAAMTRTETERSVQSDRDGYGRRPVRRGPFGG